MATGMTTFAELLRRHRIARSLTQEELAERARLTVNAVGVLERGERRRPYPHTVRALADALDLDEDERARFVGSVPERPTRSPAVVGAPGVPTAPSWPGPPLPAAPMIGRDDEVSAVGGLLRSPRRRIVTLTGPGGVGKTALALAVAQEVRGDFPGGVVLVELADVRTAGAVVPAIATALAVPEVRFDGRALSLVPFLTERRLLLVLDNLEHVLSCGPELAAVVAACPDLVVLATSRARLRLRAEQEVPVTPLGPDDAARLFTERVAAAGAVLDLRSARTAHAVTTLCERADGLPLALELAASAAARFGPATLLDRLDAMPATAAKDLPVRQRSMAATLAWSHELLGESARSLFPRLSVCAGGFSLPAAEAVAGAPPDTVLAALIELLEQSLVTRAADVEGIARFRLLEPVRQDAARRLGPAERDEARAGLAAAVLEEARDLSDELRAAGQIPALNLLDADLGNLRAAVEWFLDDGTRADDGAELLWRVASYLAIRGHARESSGWADRLGTRPLSDRGRARCLVANARMRHLTDPLRACRMAEDAAGLAERAGDDLLVAEALMWATLMAFSAGDVPTAQEFLVRVRRRAAPFEDPWLDTMVHYAVGQVAVLAGRFDEADLGLRVAERSARRLGGAFELKAVLHGRAVLSELRDRHAESAALLVAALDLAVAQGNIWTLTYLVSSLAGVAVRLGDPAVGARLFGAAAYYAVEHAVDEHLSTIDGLVRRDLDESRRRLGRAAFAAQWRQGREMGMDDLVALAHEIGRRARSQVGSTPDPRASALS